MSRQSAHEGGKVVSPTRRPPLPPRKYSWYSFLLEAESTPGPKWSRKDYVNEKFQWHHRESNPRHSDMQRSASTNCVTACPHKTVIFMFSGVRTSDFVRYKKILSLCCRGSELTLPLEWTVNQSTVTLLYNIYLLFCVKKEIGEETFPSGYVLLMFLSIRDAWSWRLAALRKLPALQQHTDRTVPQRHRLWV